MAERKPDGEMTKRKEEVEIVTRLRIRDRKMGSVDFFFFF